MMFVRIERPRENVFTVTATSQELSALVAAAHGVGGDASGL